MSWDRGITRRKIVAAGLGGLGLLALGGCNFTPLYAARTADGDVAQSLQLVAVEPIKSRVGQELRNKLIFQFTRGGEAPPPVYRLTVSLKTHTSKLAVEPQAGRGESAFVRADATYVLKRIDTDKQILQAKSVANSSFDQTEQRFANYRAELDAQNRAMAVLSEMIRTRVAAALARQAI